jgi:hypothetical protein
MVVGILVVVTACGNNDTVDADPEEVVDRAASRFAETETARFTLEIDGSIALDDEGLLALSSVEGEIERPSSAQAAAAVQFAGTSITLELVAIDGEMHLRNILTGDWERAPSDLQYDPARVFDEETGIAAILEELTDLEVEGEDSVNGRDAWHIAGTVGTAVVQSLTGDFFEGATLDVGLWIAQDDYRLLRVELHDAAAAEATSWELELTDHDEPVNISPPDTD